MVNFVPKLDLEAFSEAERRGFRFALDYIEKWAVQVDEIVVEGQYPEDMKISIGAHLSSSSQLILAMVRATRAEVENYSPGD